MGLQEAGRVRAVLAVVDPGQSDDGLLHGVGESNVGVGIVTVDHDHQIAPSVHMRHRHADIHPRVLRCDMKREFHILRKRSRRSGSRRSCRRGGCSIGRDL